MSNQDEPKKKTTGSANISDLILNSLKPRTGKETSKWIAEITDEDAMRKAVEDAAREQDAELLTSSPVRIPSRQDAHGFLDYLFDCFQQYEVAFNQNIGVPELEIHVDRPEPVIEIVREKFQPVHEIHVFRGRLSTREWTMLVRAYNNVIEAWVIPIDQLISFSGSHSDYTRFLLMAPVQRDGATIWQIDGLDVAWENIRSLARLLFGALVKVARGEASSNEPFTLKRKPAGTKSGAATVAQVEYDFDEHNPDFDSPYVHSTASSTAQTAAPAAPAPAPAVASAANPKPATKQTSPPINKPKLEKPAATGDETQSISAAALLQGISIEQAIDLLGQAIGSDLDKLAAAGSEAFTKQDLATVEKTMRQAARLKDLRDQLRGHLDEFTKAYKEALK